MLKLQTFQQACAEVLFKKPSTGFLITLITADNFLGGGKK